MQTFRILIPAVLLATLTACANKDSAPATDAKADAKPEVKAAAKPDAEPLSAEESILVTSTATVVAIDHASRNISLKGPAGNVITGTVDKRVQRLNEVRARDQVTMSYYVSLAGELRPPTEDEKKNPVAVLEGAARAPKGTDPAAGALRATRMVTTVQKIDLTNQSVTLRNPRGDEVAVRARYPENLKKIKVGDTIVVTYTEALAVSLEKTGPR